MDDLDDFESLLRMARSVYERMKTYEALRGRPFPFHALFLGGLDLIESGLASQDLLEVAVGYLVLRDVVDRIRSESASQN